LDHTLEVGKFWRKRTINITWELDHKGRGVINNVNRVKRWEVKIGDPKRVDPFVEEVDGDFVGNAQNPRVIVLLKIPARGDERGRITRVPFLHARIKTVTIPDDEALVHGKSDKDSFNFVFEEWLVTKWAKR